MNPKNLLKALTTSAFVAMAFASAGSANATTVSGNFGAGGYDVISFSVASPGTVEFQYTGGFSDPTISLFNSSGEHLISNDDDWYANSLYSHMTQNLGAGNYSLLVSYCCKSITYLANQDALHNDYIEGINFGSYWTGGTGTLSGMQAYLDADPSEYVSYMEASAYSLNINDNYQIAAVPVPAAAWLLGSGLLGLIGVVRRKPA